MPEIVEQVSDVAADVAKAAEEVIEAARLDEAERAATAAIEATAYKAQDAAYDAKAGVDALRGEVMSAIGELRTLIEKSTEAVADAAEEVTETVQDVLSEAAPDTESGITDVAEGVVEGGADAAATVASGVSEAAESGIEAVEEAPRRAHFLFRPIGELFKR